jgi:hypothetical protein
LSFSASFKGLLAGCNEFSLVFSLEEEEEEDDDDDEDDVFAECGGKLTGETDPIETEAIEEELIDDAKLLLLVELSPD